MVFWKLGILSFPSSLETLLKGLWEKCELGVNCVCREKKKKVELGLIIFFSCDLSVRRGLQKTRLKSTPLEKLSSVESTDLILQIEKQLKISLNSIMITTDTDELSL